jgi:hypothetical protein
MVIFFGFINSNLLLKYFLFPRSHHDYPYFFQLIKFLSVMKDAVYYIAWIFTLL